MSTEAADAAVVASVKEYYGKVISPPGALRRAKAQSIPKHIYHDLFEVNQKDWGCFVEMLTPCTTTPLR